MTSSSFNHLSRLDLGIIWYNMLLCREFAVTMETAFWQSRLFKLVFFVFLLKVNLSFFFFSFLHRFIDLNFLSNFGQFSKKWNPTLWLLMAHNFSTLQLLFGCQARKPYVDRFKLAMDRVTWRKGCVLDSWLKFYFQITFFEKTRNSLTKWF